MKQDLKYCTEEQTRKAWKLGAPLKGCYNFNSEEIKNGMLSLNNMVIVHTNTQSNISMCYRLPTIEEIVKWLITKKRCKVKQLIDLIKKRGYIKGQLTFIDYNLKIKK